MPLLGAHMSIAGGYHRAVESAARFGMECVQIFTKNNNQWRAKPLSDGEISAFRAALESAGIRRPCAHDSYLINLASPAEALWQKSLDSYVVELERAEALGLSGVVMHPGSHLGTGEEAGLERIVAALDRAHKLTRGSPVQTWLETTAGQGSNLGYKFEHLQFLIERCADPERLGVCVDTCHLHAAGYRLDTPAQYEATLREFDQIVGLDWIRAFHLNDSKRERGSRVDRHEHIGEGCLGLKPFRYVLNDPRFSDLPMYLETPKGLRDGKELDAMNLATLRRLVKKPVAKRR
jgi:deoxyribonuclease-4